MNRETSIHSPTRWSWSTARAAGDGSSSRAVVAGRSSSLVAVMHDAPRRRQAERPRGGQGAGQVPTVTVVVPGRSQVAPHDHRQRPARRQARPADRHRRPGRPRRPRPRRRRQLGPRRPGARDRRPLGAVAAGGAARRAGRGRARQCRARAGQLRTRRLSSGPRLRFQGGDRFARRRPATPPMRRSASRRRSLAPLAPQIGQFNVLAPASRPDPRPQCRGRSDRQPGLAARCSGLPKAARWRCRRSCRSRTLRWSTPACPQASRRSAHDRSFAGNVWQVSPVIDPQSRLGAVRIAVPLRPGDQARAASPRLASLPAQPPLRYCRKARC